jgi:hypothetical protein
MLSLDNLRPGGALMWIVDDRWSGTSVSVMWKASTSKVVTPTYVG